MDIPLLFSSLLDYDVIGDNNKVFDDNAYLGLWQLCYKNSYFYRHTKAPGQQPIGAPKEQIKCQQNKRHP